MKLFVCALAACALLSAADTKLGHPLTLKEPIPINTLVSHPDQYLGKTVQVKGRVAEVCQMMGCWMELRNDAGQKIRIKVDDGVIEFPKDAAGRTATAEGKLTKLELTRDQAIARAKEEAEETGKKFDADSVKGGTTIYQIEGSGAVISSK